jgi:hypothetical protein
VRKWEGMSINGPEEVEVDETAELVAMSTQLDIDAIKALVEEVRSGSFVSDDASSWKPDDTTL